MITMLLTAWVLVAVCVVIHATGLTMAFQWMKRRAVGANSGFGQAAFLLSLVAGWAIFLHLLQIAAWAAFYVGAGALEDFPSAFYFSAITYTTTGFGDIVLPAGVRIYSGVEALTGILMCGLSTGMFFAVFARLFGFMRAGAHNPGT